MNGSLCRSKSNKLWILNKVQEVGKNPKVIKRPPVYQTLEGTPLLQQFNWNLLRNLLRFVKGETI